MKKDQTIGRDVAVQELNRYYDALEVPEEDRVDIDLENEEKESDDPMREKVLKAIMAGRVIVEDDGKLTYTLKHPLKKESGDIVLEKLTFKLRYREHELEGNMRGVDPKCFLPMTRAYIATLTGVSKSLLGKLYNADSTVLQAIYTLFMRGDA